MSYKKQIQTLVKASFNQLRNIAKIRKYVSMDMVKTLVMTLVISRIDNCNALLFGLPNYIISKLQNVQNAAARVIVGARKYDHITPILMDLHWLPVELRIVFKINLLTYKCLHNLAPQYLRDLLVLYSPGRTLRSNDDMKLETQKYNTINYGLRAFSVHAPKLWNDLPSLVRLAPNVYVFKSRLKTHLFKTYFCS